MKKEPWKKNEYPGNKFNLRLNSRSAVSISIYVTAIWARIDSMKADKGKQEKIATDEGAYIE